jgi:hypothetical protein
MVAHTREDANREITIRVGVIGDEDPERSGVRRVFT